MKLLYLRSGATMIQYVGEAFRYLLSTPAELDQETGQSMDQRHRIRTTFGNGLWADV